MAIISLKDCQNELRQRKHFLSFKQIILLPLLGFFFLYTQTGSGNVQVCFLGSKDHTDLFLNKWKGSFT